MPGRVWRHLVFAVIAGIIVGLGLIPTEDPILRVSSAILDSTRKSWKVSGEVVYQSEGALNYPGGKAKLMERVVPFTLTIPDSSGSISYERDVLPLAIAATTGMAGRRNLNVLALEGSWMVCYGTLWLGWWLLRRRKKEPGQP